MNVLKRFTKYIFSLCLPGLFALGGGGYKLKAQQTGTETRSFQGVDKKLAAGNQYWRMGQYFEAGQQYAEILQSEPDHLFAAYRLAECQRYTFDYEAAQDAYRKVYDARPTDYPLALFYHALMLKRNRRYEEATRHFTSFIQQWSNGTDPTRIALNEYAVRARRENEHCQAVLRESPPDLTYFDRFKLAELSPEYRIKADKIVCRKEAGRLHKEEMPLYGEDAYFYNLQLSQSQRNKVAKITANGLENLSKAQMEAFRLADKNDYAQLSDTARARVNRFAVAYRRAVNRNERVILGEEDDTWYSWLSRSEKIRFDRIVAYQMHEVTNSQLARYKNKKLRQEEYSEDEESPQLSAQVDPQAAYLSLPEAQIRAEAFRYYQQLPEHEKPRLDRLVQATRVANRTGAEPLLGTEDRFFYEKLSELEKFRIDRLTDLLPEKAELTLAGQLEEDKRYYLSLPEDEKKRIDRLVQAQWLAKRSGNEMALSEEDARYYAKLSEAEKARIARLVDMLPEKTVLTLSGQLEEDKRYYASLPEKEKMRMNRIIEAKVLAKRTGNALALNKDDAHYFEKLSEIEKARLDRLAALREKKRGYRLADLSARADTPNGTAQATVAENNTVAVFFEPLFFDFDQHQLRREARKALDELATFCLQFPGVRLDIRSFADDLGTESYNRLLSEKRGKVVVNYLKDKGLAAGRMRMRAEGEQITRDAADSLYARQANRRVEIRIKGGPANYTWKYRTYLMQSKSDLAEVARAFGLTTEELKELNGTEEEVLDAYRPIRVRNAAEVVSTPLVTDPQAWINGKK